MELVLEIYSKFNFQNSIENFLLEESPKFVTIKDAEINTLINLNQKNINTKGVYAGNPAKKIK